MIPVFVVADICLYREGLVMILDRDASIKVLGAASEPAEAIAKLRGLERRPDIVLMDVAGDSGISGVRRVLQALPGIRVVALTVHEVEPEVVACAEVGIAAYVTRESSSVDLIATLVGASRGEALCSPSMTAALLRRISVLAGRGPGSRERMVLTPRELEIAELIERGLSNKQIAARLHVELPTVKNHVHRILGKIGVHRRGEAAAWVRVGGAQVAVANPR